MPKTKRKHRVRRRKYRRARVRHFLFTLGPNRLSGGRIIRRHLAIDVIVREIEIVSELWPRAFDGLRIGHVSDFHLGELLPLERALEVIALLAAQEPDFIACTGDVVDLHNHDAPLLLSAMADIDAPLGAAMVLGNHDELHDAEELVTMAEEAGIIVLRDDAMSVVHNQEELLIAGIDWAKSAARCAEHVDRACGDFAHVLLSHNPKSFLRAAELGIPVTLAGHTHGGQVALKGKPNRNLALLHRHSAGVFEADDSHMFVTNGVGAWFPLRVNCPAEIAIVTVRSAATAAS